MKDGAMNATEAGQKNPGRNCYHKRMDEREEDHRDLTTGQRVYIPLAKIAVDSADPAAILENFEQRYIQEQAESDAIWQ